MGKPDEIGEIEVISVMLKLFWHFVLSQAGCPTRLGQIYRYRS